VLQPDLSCHWHSIEKRRQTDVGLQFFPSIDLGAVVKAARPPVLHVAAELLTTSRQGQPRLVDWLLARGRCIEQLLTTSTGW
jgi:hypothetical protein